MKYTDLLISNVKLFNPISLFIGVACMGILLMGTMGNGFSEMSDASPKSEHADSVAYFVTNISEARKVNRACLKADAENAPGQDACRNALEALNLAHVGRNFQN